MAPESTEPNGPGIEIIKPAVVRVKGQDDTIKGAGFLADPQTVVTCAHVVNAALGRRGNMDPPEDALVVEFVFPPQEVMVRVAGWSPPSANDIAILKIVGTLPPAARPLDLKSVPDGCLKEHLFSAFGFPETDKQGRGKWVQGQLISQIDDVWIQLQGNSVTGGRIEPGFSGAPVLDEDLNAVIGMVVAAWKDTTEKVGYLIPPQRIYETMYDFPRTSGSATLTVWPPLLDFGMMRCHAIYHAHIRVGGGGTGNLQWIHELSSDDMFEADRQGDGILLIAAPRSGKLRSSIRVRSNAGEATIEISGKRLSSRPAAELIAQTKFALESATPDAPPYITEKQARAALQDWLRNSPELPNDLFSGRLGISNATSARLRVAHVSEHREQRRVISHEIPPTEYEDIALVDSPSLNLSHGLVTRTAWVGVKSGSSQTIRCRKCAARGFVNCAECSGRGYWPCRPSVPCDDCEGTGRFDDGSAWRICRSCRGDGVTRCRNCRGYGRIDCPDCSGTGQQFCDKCDGSGELFRYVKGSISYHVELASVLSEQSAAAKTAAHAWENDYRELVLDQEVINQLQPSFQRFLAHEMELPWSPAELVRVAELDALQAVCVTYHYGKYDGIAYVIGPDRRVRVHLSEKERRQLKLIHRLGRFHTAVSWLWKPIKTLM